MNFQQKSSQEFITWKAKIVSVLLLFLFENSYSQNLETITSESPVKITGSISTNTGFYESDNFQNTQKPFTYSLVSATNIAVYGINIPINMTITQGSKEVSNPFAQLGINPYYKFWKGYFGWTNMSWGEYVMNGKTFLGVGSEFQLGILRLGGMYGKLNPAVERDTLLGVASQYTRTGYAARVGVGTEKNHFDLMLLRGHDHIQSISTPAELSTPNPEANLVLGIKNKQSFAKDLIIWTLDGGISAHTKDLRGKDFELDSNENLLKLLNDFIPLKYGTSYSWAIKNEVKIKYKKLGLSAIYQRIEPEYKTFGVDYMMNDLQKFAFAENFSLDKGKHSFNLIQSYQHDNLKNLKAISTGRTTLGGTWNYNPNYKFGLIANYNFFLISQSEGNKFLVDSLRLAQINHNLLLQPRYMLVNEKATQIFMLMIMYQGLNDANQRSIYKIDGQTYNLNLMHQYSHNATQLAISPSFSWLYLTNNFTQIMSMGPTLAVSRPFAKNKLTPSATISYLMNLENGVHSGNIINLQIGATYQIDKHHSLRANFYKMNSVVYNTPSNNETRGDLGYTYTF